ACAASRKTSSSAASSQPEPAWNTTATSSSRKNSKKPLPACSRKSRPPSKKPSANWNSCARKAKPKKWPPSELGYLNKTKAALTRGLCFVSAPEEGSFWFRGLDLNLESAIFELRRQKIR